MGKLRARLNRELDPDLREEGISPLNLVIVILVIVSLLAMAIETEPTLPPEVRHALRTFNVFVLFLFAFEFVVRVWCAGERERFSGASGRWRWFWRPYPVADFLAFAPELIVLLFVPPEHAAAFAAFKLFRFLRLVKLAQFVPAFEVFAKAMSRSWEQLLVTVAIAFALIYIAAVALYFIEGPLQAGFASVPRAIWWAVATLTTVGYGDVYPITPLGKFAAAIIALAGVGVVALPAGILASAFADELRQREARRKRRASRDD